MYRINAPIPYTTTTITKAISDDLQEARNLTGAMIHSRATHIVNVNKMDTAVLMARIWPNFANSWMTARHKGIDPTIVVRAELRMAVPMWDTAADVLQPRISWQLKDKISLQMNIWKITYLNCRERYEFMIDHCSYTHNLSSFSAVQIYDLSYIHLHPSHSTVYYELTQLATPRWLDNSVGRALHLYRRGHWFESRSGLNFFRL